MYVVKVAGGFWVGAGKAPHPAFGIKMTRGIADRIAQLYSGTLQLSSY